MAFWALSWIWTHPDVSVVLSGMNHEDQIEENCSIAEAGLPGSLSRQEEDILRQAGDIFLESLKVGCTGCQYCLPCPAGVDIPRAFAFYNAHHMYKDKLTPWGMYLLQLGGRGSGKSSMAGNCIECGSCLKHCPQHIQIPAELKKVKRRFEGLKGRAIGFVASRIMSVKK